MTGIRPQVPWALSDARATFLTTFAGVGAVLLAWWGASGTGHLSRQTAWIAVGVVGIVVLGIGNAFWLLAGRRAIGARREVLLDLVESLGGRSEAALVDTVRPHVGVAGSGRYHMPSCLLVQGKQVVELTAQARRRRRPCEMCQP